MTGEWLGGLPLVEAVADGLVGDARGAGFELEEEVQQSEVDASAAAEERCARHVVSGHGEGALAHAAVFATGGVRAGYVRGTAGYGGVRRGTCGIWAAHRRGTCGERTG